MALNSGKILMRRGQEVNFDPNKMMPGEWAVSLDSKFVRMCFSPGVCIRMATYEAFEADMEQIRAILAECQTVEEAVQRIYEDIKDVAVDVERIETAAANALKSEQNALNSANSAIQSANTATQKASEAVGSANIASTKAEQATEGANTATQKANEAADSADNVRNMSSLSQSYAVGGTGTREGEDTDNAKYYNQQASDNADRAEAAADRASAVADVGFATTEKAGLVKPDGETIRVDPDGTIHADRGTTSYTDLENKPTINDVELNGNKTLDELGIASKEALEETDNKVNIIIENAELRFKETASGENIHLGDSAENKAVEFALFGKATQKTTSGKNLISYPHTETTHEESGVTFTDNNDGTVTVNGMSTHEDGSIYNVISPWSTALIIELQPNTSYILSGCPSGGGSLKYYLQYRLGNSDLSSSIWGSDFGEGVKIDTNDTNCYIGVRIVIRKGIPTENLVFKPMLRLASITDDAWEPYTGGIPSPNPDYPQDIDVAGESGSVEVKSVGKNLLPYPYAYDTRIVNGITYTVVKDGSIQVKGNATASARFRVTEYNGQFTLSSGNYIASLKGIVKGSITLTIELYDSGKYIKTCGVMRETEISFEILQADLDGCVEPAIYVYIDVSTNATVDTTVHPMIRLASITDNTYQPYKETLSTIPTDGLAGIKVDSGGNYTDQNGQQWICDEIVKYADGSGEKIQRVGIIDSYSTETITGVYMSTTGELTEGAKILYQLAEVITTPLTQEQLAEIEKLSTFYPVTNISNDFDCGMKVKYIADPKSYIDNRLNLIEQAILNSI